MSHPPRSKESLDKQKWECVQATCDFACDYSGRNYKTGERFTVEVYRFDYDKFICRDSKGCTVYVPDKFAKRAPIYGWKIKKLKAVAAVAV